MEEKEPKTRSYISEHIVPRKKLKKYLLLGLTLVISGVVFGIAAALTFYLTGGTLNLGGETNVETFVIARDETTVEATTRRETEKESEKMTDTDTADESAAEKGTESYIYSMYDIQQLEQVGKQIYEQAEPSMVTVHLAGTGMEDWFSQEYTIRTQQFGLILYILDDSILILTDGSDISDKSVYVTKNNASAPAVITEIDSETGMCILQVSRADFNELDIEAIELGNSYQVQQGNLVLMTGSPFGRIGAYEYGNITYREDYHETLDGSMHTLCVDMTFMKGCSACLINTSGQLIGWISDTTQVNVGNTTAFGISTLKYLLEDLCTGENTALLGIEGTLISDQLGEELGLESGFYISKVRDDSPAYTAGLQVGDRLVSLGERLIYASHDVQMQLDILNPGDEVEVVVKRSNGEEQVPIILNAVLGAR